MASFSQSRHELDIAPPEPPYQPDEILHALKQGEVLGIVSAGFAVLRIVYEEAWREWRK
ncbi:hypothetical protein KCP76_25005 [Salmonella enterica subsp. enterica serovar Weltevreden]|nr:hypothetical protein KCP76_25005 [Salmonella enterica subsp. enterica serovar Weltevreden]